MHRANREVVEQELRRLLNVIFVQVPVHETPQYLTSALSQFRRTLLDHEREKDATAVTIAPLPPWLEGQVHFGPYERSLLYRLLDESDGGVITIRGGSGSGKSSTFQHIERVANAAADQLEWKNPYNLRRFFFLIDFQATSGRIQAIRGAARDEGAPTVDAVSLLLQDMAAILDTIFTRHFTNDTFRKLVTDALQFHSGREHYTNLETAQAHLMRELDGKDTSTFKIGDYIHLFDSLEQAERVAVRLMLFTQLARELEREERGLVIVLDNVDPLPVTVQNKLVNLLATAASSYMWRPLRIVILTRISTAIHHAGVLHPILFDHASVDPADMVLYRLMWFFLSMNTFKGLMAQQPEVKSAVISRLFELWRHLVDRRGSIRRLLSAMAGTNIRNAFAYATAWCLSRQFSPEIYSEQILQEFQAHIQTLFGIYLVTELDAALARIADVQFTDAEVEQLRLGMDVESPGAAMTSQGARLADAMLTLLNDLYLLGDREGEEIDDIRHKTCIIGREVLTDTLTQPEAGGRVTWLLHLALSNAARRMAKLASPDQLPVGSHVMESFVQRLREGVAAVATADQPRVARLMDWITDIANKAVQDPIAEADVARRMVLRDNIDVRLRDRTGRAVFEPLTSRFQAAAILVNPALADPTSEPNALNVFALDRSSVSPAILRLLYLLAVRGSATVRELYSDLLWHGFTAEEIYVALRRMAAINVRLIFAGLSDSNDDLDPWLKSDRWVYLSSAGRGYFSVVVQSPPYLQWAFNDIAEVRQVVSSTPAFQTAFVQRIHSALIGFEVVVTRELEMLKETWESTEERTAGEATLRRSLSAEEVSCQSVTADVFFRSYPAFIYALFSHYKRLTVRNRAINVTSITEVRDAATKWRTRGRQWLEQHAEYFRRPYEPWQERLDIADREIEAIRNDE